MKNATKQHNILLVEPSIETLKRRNTCSLGALIIKNLIDKQVDFSCDYLHMSMKKELIENIKQFDFAKYEIVAFSILSPTSFFNLYPFIYLSRIAKEDVFIIAGGAGIVNPLPISRLVDLIFLGYAEDSLKQFLNLWRLGKITKDALPEISGTYSRRKKQIINPGFSAIDIDLYRNYSPLRKHAEVELTRGCKGHCTFCQESRFPNISYISLPSFRKYCSDLPNKEKIRLAGPDIFDHPQIDEILDIIDKRGLGYPFGVSISPRNISYERLSKLSKIGVKLISMGVEGFSEKLRKAVGKPFTQTELIDTFIKIQEIGFSNLRLLFILNLPNQIEDDIIEFIETLRVVECKSIKPFNIKISLTSLVPRPFTKLQNFSITRINIQDLDQQKRKLINEIKELNNSKITVSFTKNTVIENDYLAQFVYFAGEEFDNILQNLADKGFIFYGNNYSKQHTIKGNNNAMISGAYNKFGMDDDYLMNIKSCLAKRVLYDN